MRKKCNLSFGLMVMILGIAQSFQYAYAQDSDQSRAAIEICFSGSECFDAHTIYFGSSQTATTHVGGGGGAGKVSIDDIALTRSPDKYSPILFLMNANGQHIKKTKINIRMLTGEGLLINSIKMELDNIIISSYRLDANVNAYPVEKLTLNFSRIRIVVRDSTGMVVGEAGWDISRNAEL